MGDKPTKSAEDLKLMLEVKLRDVYPECKRAEVIIVPPASHLSWTARLLGAGATTDDPCRQRLYDVLAELRGEFDLNSLK